MAIRIFLADDHRMFREALRTPLAAEPDLEVVAEAGTGQEILNVLKQTPCDILLLDINLPDLSGLEIAAYVTSHYPQIHVIALSGYTDRVFVDEMLAAGARAYVVKSAGSEELLFAIRAVSKGHRFLSPEVTAAVLSPPSPISCPLSQREQEILKYLASGQRSSEIATTLEIAPATVDVHRRNIKRKLGLSSIAELTRYAIRTGLLNA